MEYLRAIDIYGTPAANYLTIRKKRTVKTTCGALASIVFFMFAGVILIILCGAMTGKGSYIQQSLAVKSLPT